MNVSIGDRIPEWVIDGVSAERMKTTAALLRDPTPIHWDPSTTSRYGLGDRVFNQTPLNVGYIVNMLHAWAGPQNLRRLKVEPRNVALDGDCLVAHGVVSEIREEDGVCLAECDVWLDRKGIGTIMRGTAVIVLPTS